VPVVAGFQGYYWDDAEQRDEVSILGRGGSNLTAVALADALEQTECTMFSNVDGIYDKDPNKHVDAVKLSDIKASELLTWDPFPQVIQKEAVLYAVERGVDIWIRDGFDPNKPGTLIRCRE
jgi:aspartate kinase